MSRMKWGIALRLGVLLASFSVFAATLAAYSAFDSSRDRFQARSERSLLATTHVLARHMQSGFGTVVRDTSFLASVAGTDTDRGRLADVFKANLAAHPSYLQIRLIGLQDHGLELVRIDRVGDPLVRVPDDALQEKSHVPFVFEALALRAGEVYVSEFGVWTGDMGNTRARTYETHPSIEDDVVVLVQLHKTLVAEEHIKPTFAAWVGSECNGHLQQGVWHLDLVPMHHCFSVVLDHHNGVCARIFDLREATGIGPGADLVALVRAHHAQCFMWSLVVVYATPMLKSELGLMHVSEASSCQHLALERAMKAFDLPVGLRMIGSAVADPDTQADQPYAELGQAMARKARAAPGRTVICVDPNGQAIALKHSDQVRLHTGRSHAVARLQRKIEARMVVQQRQRIATPLCQIKVAFEVDLPQSIGQVMLKAQPWRRVHSGLGADQAMAVQDGGYGAGRGHLGA